MAVLHKARGLSFVAGAPRHKQRGLFEAPEEGGQRDQQLHASAERASRYLLEGAAPSPHHYYRWGSRDPRGKEWAPGHTEGGGPCLNRTQPWPRLCVPECQLVFPIVGDPAVHPASCVILENILTWSDPNRMVQEEHEQRGLAWPGAGGGGGSGGGGPWHSPLRLQFPGL